MNTPTGIPTLLHMMGEDNNGGLTQSEMETLVDKNSLDKRSTMRGIPTILLSVLFVGATTYGIVKAVEKFQEPKSLTPQQKSIIIDTQQTIQDTLSHNDIFISSDRDDDIIQEGRQQGLSDRQLESIQ